MKNKISSDQDLNKYLEESLELEGKISGSSTFFNHKSIFDNSNDLMKYRFMKLYLEELDLEVVCLIEGKINNFFDDENFNLTKKVNVSGIVKILPYNLSNEKGVESFDNPVLLINKVKFIEQEKTNFSKSKIKEFKEFSKSKTALKDSINLISPKIIGSDFLKESMLLQHIGANEDQIHILFLGDAGTGKTVSMQENLQLNKNSIYSLASNYGKDFITYKITKNFIFKYCNMLSLGKLLIMENSIVGFDEISKFVDKKVKQEFENILKKNQLEIFEDGFSFNLNIKNSILAASNQKVDDFSKKSIEQKRLLEIFDLVFVIEDIMKGDSNAVDVLTTGILNQLSGNFKLESNISRDFLKEYLIYTRENFNPILTPDSISLLKEKWNNLLSITRNDYTPIKIGERQLLALKRLSESYAKFYCQNEVLIEHVEMASTLFMRCFETHNPLTSDLLNVGRLSKESQNISSKKTIFMQVFLNLKQKYDANFVDYNELSLELLNKGFKNLKEIEEVLSKLKNEGELFQPTNKIIKSISDE